MIVLKLVCPANHLQGLQSVCMHTTQTHTHTRVYVCVYVDIIMISLIDHGSVMMRGLEMLIIHHIVLGERVTEARVDLFTYYAFL